MSPEAITGLFGSRVDKLAAHGDADGLIALLGQLDKADVRARHALIAMGADAVPALLACALGARPAGAETTPDTEAAGPAVVDAGEEAAPSLADRRAAAAHTVLVCIGDPTVRAVTGVIRTSDDRATVGEAAELLYRTALATGAGVPDELKAEVESKTGVRWADVVGEEPNAQG